MKIFICNIELLVEANSEDEATENVRALLHGNPREKRIRGWQSGENGTYEATDESTEGELAEIKEWVKTHPAF